MRYSVLCPSRPNSEYLTHFICNFLVATGQPQESELLVMMNAADTWNSDARLVFDDKVRFFAEPGTQGRFALHEYYNALVPHVRGDWFVLVCEDFELRERWDELLSNHIVRNTLHPDKPHVILPRFREGVPGYVMHVLSRGYVRAVGGVLSGHYSVDSWLNTILGEVGDKLYSITDEVVFDDYTHNKPSKGHHPYRIPTVFPPNIHEISGSQLDTFKSQVSILRGMR